MKNNNRNVTHYVVITCGILLLSCSSNDTKDPLQNTKKLVKEGHVSLYQNGAFEVPATTIHLIPPGPSALELAMELAGISAAQSFQTSIQHARESIDFAKLGVKKSIETASTIVEETDRTAANARTYTKGQLELAANAPSTTKAITAASIEYAGIAYKETANAGSLVVDESAKSGQDVREKSREDARQRLAGSVDDAAAISRSSATRIKKGMSSSFDRFVKGYAAVPSKFGRRIDSVAASASLSNFVKAAQKSERWRQNVSAPLSDIIVDTTTNYDDNVKQAFANAGDEITHGAEKTGYTLAVLKSLRWVLQGIVWEATIKPAAKISSAALGYITVNAVAYPALITVNEGLAVANIAVEVTWNSAGAAYDITAPTAVSAVTGLFSAADFVASQTFAAGKLVVDTTVAGATYAGGQTVGTAATATGFVAGKTIQYVGAPLAAVGIAGAGVATGVVAGSAQAVGGTLGAAAGATAEVATQVGGKSAAGVVAVGGSAASIAAGGALGSYELSKAIVAPTGYAMGGGIVLSYGTLSQLSAQSILAVSDAAYVVLSLEGPRWVVYAVKGTLNKGENIPTGTVLDLEAMRTSGEKFYTVPASDEEIKNVVDNVYPSLPQKTESDQAN